MNQTLKNATQNVNHLVNESKYEQQQHFQYVLQELEHQEARTTPIIQNITKQDEANKILLHRLDKIEAFNHEIIKKYEKEGVVNQAIIDQLTIQDSAIQRLSKNIEQYGGQNKSLSEQIEDQNNMYEEIVSTFELQEAFHKTILERLNHQEALSQKMSRDLDSLRAVLFERISYVIEKIDDNYKQIIGYVSKLFTKAGFNYRISIEKDNKEKKPPNRETVKS
jgi:predicted transcriptional regulator